MDIFATILDYLGASQHDNSDGRSLRRYIDRTNFNQYFDDQIVVSEMDKRVPLSNRVFKGDLGGEPNYMIRKDDFVLIMTKKADSPLMDMFYDLRRDPYQEKNLLANNGANLSNEMIGKAEHLRCLLVEWLRRVDGTTVA